ncbi:MAG: glycosyltransferase family 2 protein [Gemmatimonadetes bacterium]|nr:glycosyltransferase family 2 protein [Gemmatimonadota bacterium]
MSPAGPGGGVTLCVVNYNGAESLPDTLAAATASSDAFVEILLVDNASTDDSVEMVRSRFPGVRIHATGRNGGPGAARNAGLRQASTARVLFVDNDVVLAPACAGHLGRALDERADAAVAMPRVLYADDPGTIQFSGAGCHYLGLMTLHEADVSLADTTPGDGSSPASDVDSVVTACFLFDRARWPLPDPFDEALFMHYEDHDFGVRARLAGHALLSVPGALCYHGAGTPGLALRTTGVFQPLRVYGTICNRWQVLAKSYAGRTIVLLAPMLLTYEVVQLVAVVRKGWTGEWLRAVGWMVGHSGDLAARRRRVQRSRRVPDREILRGGRLPFTRRLAQGRLERGVEALLNRMAAAYWKRVRGWL